MDNGSDPAGTLRLQNAYLEAITIYPVIREATVAGDQSVEAVYRYIHTVAIMGAELIDAEKKIIFPLLAEETAFQFQKLVSWQEQREVVVKALRQVTGLLDQWREDPQAGADPLVAFLDGIRDSMEEYVFDVKANFSISLGVKLNIEVWNDVRTLALANMQPETQVIALGVIHDNLTGPQWIALQKHLTPIMIDRWMNGGEMNYRVMLERVSTLVENKP